MANTIEIKITADNSQALAALKQVSNAVKQAAGNTNSAGAEAGKGFNESAIEIQSASNRIVNVLNQISSTLTSLSAKFGMVGTASSSMQDAANKAKNASTTIVQETGKIGTSGVNAAEKIGQIGTETEKAKNKLANLGGSNSFSGIQTSGEGFLGTLSKIGMSIYGIVETFNLIKEAGSKLFGTGLSYDQQMETAKMGVAGILVSMTTWNGEQMKLNQAMQISQQTINQIQEQATQIGLVPNELVTGFQSILGPGLQAKMTIQEIVQLTTMGTKAVKTMLGPQANDVQITQELRSMVSGTIDQNSQVSRALGITNADVENAKQSAGGLFAYLKEQLSGFKDLAEEAWPNSMTGIIERFKAMFSQASGSASQTIFDDIKVKVKELTNSLFIVDQTTKQVSFNPELLSTIKTVVDYTVLLGEKTIYAGQVIEPYLSTPLRVTGTILKFIIDNIYGVTTALLTWTIIQKAIDLFNTLALKIEASRKQLIELRTASNVTTGAMVAGANTAAVAVTRIEAAANLAKIAIRGLASATLWGAIAVMAGWAVEKIMNEFDKIDQRKNKSKTSSPTSTDIGNLSSKYEGQSDSVSTGKNDPYGGVSYGAWQLSSKQGSATNFVNWLIENEYGAGQFLKEVPDTFDEWGNYTPAHELVPGTPEFTARWHEAVQNYGDSFYEAQKNFIKETYYDPFNSTLGRDFGFNANDRSSALQQVLWSTVVQHGQAGAYDIMMNAADLAGAPNISWLQDKDLIPYIYQARRNAFSSDSNRYDDEEQTAMQILAAHPQRSQPSRGNGMDLKNPPQDVEALARAKIALANAQADNILQEDIAKLKNQEQALDNRNSKTNAGTASPDEFISAGEYTKQKIEIATKRTNAEIEVINQKIASQNSLLSNKNLTMADRKNIETEVSKLQSQIRQKQTDLKTTIDGLNNAQDTALQAVKDEAADVIATNLENKGKLAEAEALRQQKQYRAQREKFTANNMPDALKALEENAATALNQANFNQTQKDLEKADREIVSVQSELLLKVYNGTRTAVEVIKEYSDIYSVRTKSILDNLNEELKIAETLGLQDRILKIKEAIQSLQNAISDFYEKTVKQIEDTAQNVIKLINADKSKTTLVKSKETEDVQKKQYRDLAAAQLQEADRLSNLSDFEKELHKNKYKQSAEFTAQTLRDAAKLNQELGRTTTLLEDVGNAGRQGLENGLVNFFEQGYQSCHKLIDAVRDLSITILTEMNKVFAQDLTRRLMSKFGFGQQGSSSSWSLSDGTNLDSNFGFKGLFASGGNMDSGVVKGPGTGTSDSILAYLGNFKKFIGLSDGEFVIKSATVKKFGTNFFDKLNNGLIPDGFGQVKAKFATGGSVSGTKIAGAQDLAASLTNNNVTNIPLKIINLTDPNEVGKYLQSRAGEKVMVNWVKNNATTVKHLLR